MICHNTQYIKADVYGSTHQPRNSLFTYHLEADMTHALCAAIPSTNSHLYSDKEWAEVSDQKGSYDPGSINKRLCREFILPMGKGWLPNSI